MPERRGRPEHARAANVERQRSEQDECEERRAARWRADERVGEQEPEPTCFYAQRSGGERVLREHARAGERAHERNRDEVDAEHRRARPPNHLPRLVHRYQPTPVGTNFSLRLAEDLTEPQPPEDDHADET